jgi:uncharacterized protein YbjT (DUF2867 family)
MSMSTVVITGALSFTGKYATRLLLDRGFSVRTLTHHSERPNPFGEHVKICPYNFEHPEELCRSLEGASTLINTYWVRFPHGSSTFEIAVRNSRTLVQAAKDAGIPRIIHVSIANPSLKSPLAYYHGKAEVEDAVVSSGMSYAILRPTVIFGAEDILINNIAWFIRNFPIFAIPGNGSYGVRPIYVEDMACLLVDAVNETANSIRDAVGPETFSFDELVKLIAQSMGRRIRLVHVPAIAAYFATWLVGRAVRDVVLTREEYEGLMANLLAPEGPSAGHTRLSKWLAQNADQIGKRYASEVARHF